MQKTAITQLKKFITPILFLALIATFVGCNAVLTEELENTVTVSTADEELPSLETHRLYITPAGDSIYVADSLELSDEELEIALSSFDATDAVNDEVSNARIRPGETKMYTLQDGIGKYEDHYTSTNGTRTFKITIVNQDYEYLYGDGLFRDRTYDEFTKQQTTKINAYWYYKPRGLRKAWELKKSVALKTGAIETATYSKYLGSGANFKFVAVNYTKNPMWFGDADGTITKTMPAECQKAKYILQCK